MNLHTDLVWPVLIKPREIKHGQWKGQFKDKHTPSFIKGLWQQVSLNTWDVKPKISIKHQQSWNLNMPYLQLTHNLL